MLYSVAGLLRSYEVEIFGGDLMADGRKKKVQEVSGLQRCPGRGLGLSVLGNKQTHR